MPDQQKPTEKDAPVKLTPQEEADLRAAATRGSYVKEFELQGRTYMIGTASGAADRHWHDQKVIARIVARKKLRDDLMAAYGLKNEDPFPFFISEQDVDVAAIPASNDAYVATHIRSVDGTALEYKSALDLIVNNTEAPIREILIEEINAMYRYYRGAIIKLQYESNAKKSQALVKSSTGS